MMELMAVLSKATLVSPAEVELGYKDMVILGDMDEEWLMGTEVDVAAL